MKAFFQKMNLARAIILFAVVGSIALAVNGWSLHKRLADLRDDLTVDAPKLTKELMRLGHQHTQLQRTKSKEGLGPQTDFQTYIRTAANKDGVEIGEVKLIETLTPRSQGVADKVMSITPSDRERKYERYRIANFLYSLERDSRRVKVTHVKMNVSEKNLKYHEIPEDLWTFEAAASSRERTDKPEKGEKTEK
jgi:hypothetical protein